MSDVRVEWVMAYHFADRPYSHNAVPVVRLEALLQDVSERADVCFDQGNTAAVAELESLWDTLNQLQEKK